jgi:alpha-tubulin suppressor-like RCC1 family protein
MSGDVSCWGDPPAASHSPTTVPIIHDALAVRAGYSHACALRSDHSVWCWGTNSHGELGDGTGAPTTGFVMTPVQVVGLPPIASLGQAYGHTCAIDTSGFVWCWGLNDHGQIGDGTTMDAVRPIRVALP